MRPGPVPSVEAPEAERQVTAGEALLVDVRERDEWDTVRAPGAVLVPMSELQARAADLPHRPMLLICHSGSRSMAAANYLRMLGREATNVSGGMVAWERAGLPVRTGPRAPGEGELEG
jgi:rhodanese-related sulfurtransferase